MGGRARLPIAAIGCALLVVGLAAVLSHAVPVRTGTNDALAKSELARSGGRVEVCQNAELIPAGTGAVRVSLAATSPSGPPLALVATNGRTTIGRGALAAGWSGQTATIPLRPVTHVQRPAHVCVTIGASASVALRGEEALEPSATAAGTRVEGRLRLEYLAPERATWWSQIGTIARRMGFGHAVGGSAVAIAAALLTLGAASLGLWQLVRDAR